DFGKKSRYVNGSFLFTTFFIVANYVHNLSCGVVRSSCFSSEDWQYCSRRLIWAGKELPASFCSSVLTRAIRIAFIDIPLCFMGYFLSWR
ncbi:MAG TPA: hypothetical protein VJJ26_01695, partial [Candidatus Babeliales bacterium]|nr:hypothetical protein [Candidatus Babeliales bacterium]